MSSTTLMTFRIVGGTDYASEPHNKQQLGLTLMQAVDAKLRRDHAATQSTATGKNKKLRKQRAEVWRAAEAAVNYWHARMRFEDAIEIARRNGIPEAGRHPVRTPEDHMPLMENYRSALAEQLLTPAPDVASVNWKQAFVDRDDYIFHHHVEKERVESAIADDLAFLRAHPTRRPRR